MGPTRKVGYKKQRNIEMKSSGVMRMDILFFSLEVVNCEEQGNGPTTRLVTSPDVRGLWASLLLYINKKNYHLGLQKEK